MKIIAVCGLGMGSSLILKMTLESVMSQLGIDCDIEHWDMGTIKGQVYDLLITTESFRDSFSEISNVVYVKNIMDASEVKEKISNYLNQKG